MSQPIRVGIIGAGWPGGAHARGYQQAGGFRIVAVADLIPQRRQKLKTDTSAAREYADAKELIADEEIDVVSIGLPNWLHAETAIAALRAGKHVLCEKPPALSVREARKMQSAAEKAGKVLLFSFQRRFRGAEQAARQAIERGYAGEVYHARSQWLRTRGIPIGTGWFTQKDKSGGGAMIDIGVHMLDLAWHLLGQPQPRTVLAATHCRLTGEAPKGVAMDVEDSAFALIRFEGGQSLELGASWALNQPPQQEGSLCRIYGDNAAVDVYTPQGAVIYRNFDSKGKPKATPLKPPRVEGHAALMRHFKDCIHGRTQPKPGPAEAVVLMQMIEAIYESAQSGKSVSIKQG